MNSRRSVTRESLLRLGVELLTEQTYSSTGLDALLRRAGVPKGSFYHHFASKADYTHAVIDAYGAYFAKKLERTLQAPGRTPLAGLAAFIDSAIAGMARYACRRGCLAGNLGQELAAQDEHFRQQLDALLSDWQRRVANCLRAAIAAGELSADCDAEAAAALFWIAWEGAILRAKLAGSTAPLQLLRTQFFCRVLGVAEPPFTE